MSFNIVTVVTLKIAIFRSVNPFRWVDIFLCTL